ncbi:WavE lipopolysaccharide synthesis family protein [Serratia ureilytica]|uniref:WavE lipopolysaccharide synthesis family protein n=1 Tax=Serratia ureilytica TaxID=300181 RepID=UPI0034C5ECF4
MRDLSIIFQGPATPEDRRLFQHLRQTRQIFPDAEIILATWHLTPVSDHQLQTRAEEIAVRLVLSDDPGPLTGKDPSGQWSTNLNRLLCSARAGLASATRPLAVKLRTDTWLSGRQLLPLLEQIVDPDSLPPREQAYRVFRQRVITASWFARDARGSLPFLYHPGDILLAGLTEDVRLFFMAPLAGPELFCPATMPGLWCAWRFVPEQWLWVHAIHRATGRQVYAGNFQHTPQHIVESERYFLANFVPWSPRQLGLHWPKYWRRYPFRGLFSLYTHTRWRRRLQGGQAVRDAASRLLTGLWRTGYRLRTRCLRWPPLRALARRLFSHHQ